MSLHFQIASTITEAMYGKLLNLVTCFHVAGWQVMASVEDSSQPVNASASGVCSDASLSTGNENAVQTADAEARCMFTYSYF